MSASLFAAIVLGQGTASPAPTIKTEIAKSGFYEINVAWPVFPDSHPLASVLNRETLTPVRLAQQEFVNAARSYSGPVQQDWALQIKPVVSYNSQKLVSIYYEHYEYAGGAHPNTFSYALNVAMIEGKPKKITLSEIAVDGAVREILELVRHRLSGIRFDRVSEEVAELPAETASKFLVSKNGLTFVFDRYSVGPYVEGEYIVKLRYAEIPGLINRDLIPEAR